MRLGGVIPVVAKLGLSSHVQLSVSGSGAFPPESGTIGLGDLTFGLKWRIVDSAPAIGSVAILPSAKVPSGSPVIGTGTTDTGVLLISSRAFGPVSLDLNAGYTERSGNGSGAPRRATVWAASFGGPAGGPIGWVAELYGYPRTTGPAGQAAIVATLFGPTISVRPWLTLDAGAIVPLTGPQPHAAYVGGVWNVGRAWR
jgi:hypothetical protein